MSSQGDEKSTGIALLLSFFVTGLGQIYQGRTKVGVIFLGVGVLYGGIAFVVTLLTGGLAAFVLGPIGLAFWGFNLYDAYAEFLTL